MSDIFFSVNAKKKQNEKRTKRMQSNNMRIFVRMDTRDR